MVYVGTKQLGGIISVADAANGDTIGTSLEIAQARVIVFNQATAGVTVNLSNPSPTTPKMLVLQNRGSEAITVGSTSVEPGPAYGMFWDGSAYVSQNIEGIGKINSKVDSNTIEIIGDGSPVAPLELNVVVDPSTSNALEVTLAGLYVRKTGAGYGLITVDAVVGNDTNVGNSVAPFATIGRALQEADGITTTYIVIYPATYTEDIEIPANTYLLGMLGSDFSRTVKIRGQVTYAADASLIVCNGVDIEHSTTSVPAMYCNNTDGNIVFENCRIAHSQTGTAESIRFTAATGDYTFVDCDIPDIVNIQDGCTANVKIIGGGGILGQAINNSANSTLIIKDKDSINTVLHSKGKVSVQNIRNIVADANNDCIVSTSNDGILILNSISTLQDDGSFGDIVKTGTSDYAFSNVARDPNNNSFTGTALLVEQATDIHANYVPSAYTPISDDVAGHLEGIDSALSGMGGGLSSVSSSDSATIDFDGAGTVGSPITASVKRSAASGNALLENIDGLFVPTADVGLESVSSGNSDTINITGDGTPSDPLVAEVSISASANNRLTSDATGLFVPPVINSFDIVFTTSYEWLAAETLFIYRATKEFTLPQNLVNSQILMRARAGIDVSTQVELYKTVGSGSPTLIGYISFSYTASGDTLNTYVVSVASVFASDQNFAVGDTLTLITTDAAVFDIATIDLLATRQPQ